VAGPDASVVRVTIGPMSRYSLGSLLRHALGGHRAWGRAWRSPEPQARYDAIVVGGGGHGLATAYYLARNHGLTRVAVLEQGWIGGGNSGRNTAIVRSNYGLDDSARLYEHSLKLWEGLSQELNFNLLFSQRGLVWLAHSHHERDALLKTNQAMRRNGIDQEWWQPQELATRVPGLDLSSTARFPVLGAAVQPRAGIARHDAVVWAYARAASALGVDIIEQCRVTGFLTSQGRVEGVETSRGLIRAPTVGLAVAGHSSALTALAGLRLPLLSFPLQAFVSEPLKPVLDTVVVSTTVGIYVSQSDKGELVFGAARDRYPSYAQRGSFGITEDTVAGLLALFPGLAGVRLLRSWGGIVDVTPDSSPIIGPLPLKGLFLNAGWGTGGFKAIPGSGQLFAHTLARGQPHPLVAPFGLERFREGRLIDEAAATGVGHG